MKLMDEKEGNKIKYGLSLTSKIFWVITFVIMVILLVCYVNRDKAKAILDNKVIGQQINTMESSNPESMEETTTDSSIIGSNLSQDDLNDTSANNEDIEASDDTVSVPTTEKPTVDDREQPSDYFTIILPSGDLESVKINPYITKNTYNEKDFTVNNIGRASNSTNPGILGVTVSGSQGFIDFIKVKKDGIEFAMLSAGCRGYGTGQIVVDEYLTENLYNANNAGVSTGIYFCSQAITKEEAIEEANLIISLIKTYTVDYPIVFRMDDITNDVSRTKDLSKLSRTSIAKSFLDTIKSAGYDAALYGSPFFLIKRVELSQFNGYDIWLSSEINNSYFPYQFTMWEYASSVNVDGIAGGVPLSISILDYKIK